MSATQIVALPGSEAFSEFRQQALALQAEVEKIKGHYIHYVDLLQDLDENASELLTNLLSDGATTTIGQDIEGAKNYYVLPRPGTISPWSSKATNIAQVCGLRRHVRRVERGIKISVKLADGQTDLTSRQLDFLHDRMTEKIYASEPNLVEEFVTLPTRPLKCFDLSENGASPLETLQELNRTLGLALDAAEIQYLADAYSKDGPVARKPTDVELFMFAQVNSEHCRHKIFNATWTVDGKAKVNSLFGMIRNTHRITPRGTVSAYEDNAAVLEGFKGTHWAPSTSSGQWLPTDEMVPYLAKVETHNHPTAVSPFPGAATGSGGEIRDEGAVGRGSKPKAGLVGFTVSDLLIPGHRQPWELDYGKPNHIASSLDIMLNAPLGAAAFNNEFGRPCINGYFRTFLAQVDINSNEKEVRGYHKPIMIAGGIGTVRPQLALKDPDLVPTGAHLIVMGGPAMLIGLGGGAASSVTAGTGSVDLDFASVQRGNPEMQRRAQEVINSCSSLGQDSPILFIHDVGAGGLSNALPELIKDAGFLGAKFELRDVDNADGSMSPMEIWCCEAQERYVLAVAHDGLNKFRSIAERERCRYSIVGQATGEKNNSENRVVLVDRNNPNIQRPIDLPMSVLFGKPPKMVRDVQSRNLQLASFDHSLITYLPGQSSEELLNQAINRVLQMPAVGSKSFLITIGDRTVGGLTARDQFVGPWAVPLADVGVTATSLTHGIRTGEAEAMGEKPMLALISHAASARMAVAEALMNITAAHIKERLTEVKLSANWMSAASHPGEGVGIYEAVEALGMHLCPELGISIPVGKDSMSMKMRWQDNAAKESKEVTAPLSLVISAFAPVLDVTRTWTPQVKRYNEVGETSLFFVDLGLGHKSMGGSILAQSFKQTGNDCPDIRDVHLFKDFFDATQKLHEQDLVLAYHDRSDGGLFSTLAEMCFAGRCGMSVSLESICATPDMADIVPTLFNEELGAVFQVRKADETKFKACFATCGPPPGLIYKVGSISKDSSTKQNLSIYWRAKLVYRASRSSLQQTWSNTSHWMQKLRDNPHCSDQEYDNILDNEDTGLSYHLTFDPKQTNLTPVTSTVLNYIRPASKPRVAILRDQGTNGQAEMAFAFHTAGFLAYDVHMTDVMNGRTSLSAFQGLALCGGFSFGDVLGAGQGWAKSILFHPPTKSEFEAFFKRADTFTLGVCNGCQVLSKLKTLIPGAETWPSFERNESEQYEARVCMVSVSDPPPTATSGTTDSPALSPSVFLNGMHTSALPIATAHGEGRASFICNIPQSTLASSSKASLAAQNEQLASEFVRSGLAPLRYVDNNTLKPTQKYPFNPNGSPDGIAGVRSKDGRVLALMPHPERTVLGAAAGSYVPESRREEFIEYGGAWMRLFRSARGWCG
ncbi:phosphoribosylformylglycinamidine synthase [Lithohypha guttulata]|uniref:phosphoribosylformylglycinamidine synthase n=1 Tax=Lithohypha guttulata TaxID=1690604 RepID=UPI002DE1F200|nr:phosphoribosylformylglycinamidine synthase [Lithohypha guttulata]